MFVGRESELTKLEKMYSTNEFQFAVIYGRRRVGKTTLIREFLKNKESLLYVSLEGTQKENLIGLSRVISRNDSIVYDSFESLFNAIDKMLETNQKIVLAIDEYPYLAESYPPISSIIQKHIDLCWKDKNMFLILCGSSMSFMENQVLGYKSPLYGRRSAQFKITPFTYLETQKMLVNYDQESQAIAYGITGGIPEYLSKIDTNKSLDENILDLFFDDNGALFEEATNLLKQEMRNPASYNSILGAIASGASRLNEIANKVGLDTSACSGLLKSLIELNTVEKIYPVTEKESSRKTIYEIKDTMFLFWYKFVRPNYSNIQMGLGHIIYDQYVKPKISDYMGYVFEKMSTEYLYQKQVFLTLPFIPEKIGTWWGNDPTRKEEAEIDIVAINSDSCLLCECKWRNKELDSRVLTVLNSRKDIFKYKNKSLMAFSKSGFTEDAIEYAKNNDIRLVSFEMM